MIRKPAPGGAEIGRRATSRPLSQRSGGEGDEDEQAADGRRRERTSRRSGRKAPARRRGRRSLSRETTAGSRELFDVSVNIKWRELTPFPTRSQRTPREPESPFPRRRGAPPEHQFGRDETHHVRLLPRRRRFHPAHQPAHRHPAQTIRGALDEGIRQGEGRGELGGVAPDDRQVVRHPQPPLVGDRRQRRGDRPSPPRRKVRDTASSRVSGTRRTGAGGALGARRPRSWNGANRFNDFARLSLSPAGASRMRPTGDT